MYAEAGLQPLFLQGCPPEAGAAAAHQFPGGGLLPCFHTDAPTAAPHVGNLVRTATISEYDLGGEGDLFKAPEPVIEEPVLVLDPMTAAMSMINVGGDVTTAETIKVLDLESVQNEHLLSEVFYGCKMDLLAKSGTEVSLPELSDFQIPVARTQENSVLIKNKLVAEGPMQKSVSSGCLNSAVWINGGTMRSNFIDFQGVDLGTAFGLRRAYSEGDLQTLGSDNLTFGNMSTVQSSFERLLTIGESKIEERRQKLSRYRKKKTKRNFGRRIKYACRKALADSQPRVRGRFAKTEECEAAKLQK